MDDSKSMLDAVFDFAQACFIGTKTPPAFSDADMDALALAAEEAAFLDAQEVAAWPSGQQGALYAVLREIIVRLTAFPHLDHVGAGAGSTPTRLTATATEGIALGARTIRSGSRIQ